MIIGVMVSNQSERCGTVKRLICLPEMLSHWTWTCSASVLSGTIPRICKIWKCTPWKCGKPSLTCMHLLVRVWFSIPTRGTITTAADGSDRIFTFNQPHIPPHVCPGTAALGRSVGTFVRARSQPSAASAAATARSVSSLFGDFNDLNGRLMSSEWLKEKFLGS